ncbi:hypothetical protein VSDG_01980 [Cytospora chrysosperma]|uniref:Serine-threonine protein kinase 19 n=1 Tax=Cytospora chrysosperma TaxID=252740 RepID=A0A423WE49_CYTCH|nr:hypothetical protein VSDG_01980 [Valsa sordida]
MSSRLKSILKNPNRVVKRKPPAPRRASSGGSNSNGSRASSSWSDSLPRTKAGPSSARHAKTSRKDEDDEDKDEDFFQDRLDDLGLVQALAADLTLRDVPQAMRYSREHMFTPVPGQTGSLGMSSTRVAEVLNARRNLPPVVTTAHLQALLRSPTAVERETAELVRAGVLRKVVVLRRGRDGGVGEFLVASSDLQEMVTRSAALEDGTKAVFLQWLKDNPAKMKVSAGDGGLEPAQIDQLVRGGFSATSHGFDAGSVTSVFARPEDRGTSISLETVSRAAAGSVDAVGGEGAVHASGGSGGGRAGGRGLQPGGAEISLAVPGQGAYLKLVSAALSQLTGILGKSVFKEMPENLLRERWDGGVANGSKQHAGKRERREFVGVLPGRTKKWKDFYGMAFDWVLHEAVGAGLVEVFVTGSVGRGIRLL